jgi:hypothetical protein
MIFQQRVGYIIYTLQTDGCRCAAGKRPNLHKRRLSQVAHKECRFAREIFSPSLVKKHLQARQVINAAAALVSSAT